MTNTYVSAEIFVRYNFEISQTDRQAYCTGMHACMAPIHEMHLSNAKVI